ncbi:hypothetical protein F5J12DRAFT_809376 [Pisolithus orientalis]|uniref:uncharacterized protein n=1 Tax=Pisolithus orientalis TaxID=936130 RepID=UPI0022255C5D|nr:uncharacterized protein F5J12DRAFT_809376 [Pisolithus orientalis]KAI6025621.1 hypothetical protein F5J12DRAFT_809376 [Pisolithus orientalis]
MYIPVLHWFFRFWSAAQQMCRLTTAAMSPTPAWAYHHITGGANGPDGASGRTLRGHTQVTPPPSKSGRYFTSVQLVSPRGNITERRVRLPGDFQVVK